MRKNFLPLTVVPGAKRRINPDTLMPAFDSKGNSLWDMPAPIKYAEHTRWRRHKKTDKRVAEPVQVPVYRGASASYASCVKSQIRRSQRKAAEAQATVDALNAAENNAQQETEKAIEDLVLNPGGHHVEAEQFEAS